MNPRKIGYASGFSLIEVMVATGILLVVTLGMASVIADFQRQGKQLDQKLEVMQNKTLVQQLFADPAKCTCQFSSTNTFDSTATPGSQAIELNMITSNCAAGALFSKNQVMPSGLKITKISLKNLVPLTPPQWQANWEIEYSGFASNNVRAQVIPQLVNVKTTAPSSTTAATIDSCEAGSNPTMLAMQIFTGAPMQVMAATYSWTSPNLAPGLYTVIMYSTLQPPRAGDDGCPATYAPKFNGVAAHNAIICADDENQNASLNYPTFMFKSVPVTTTLNLVIPPTTYNSMIHHLSVLVYRE